MVFGIQPHVRLHEWVAEERGFFAGEGLADGEAVERYFRALLRAQQEIDLEPHRYTRHWAKELPADLLELVDVRRFGPGERVVPQPYTRDMFDRTQSWMREWDPVDPAGTAPRYETTVLV